ncbi:hexon assembly protein 100K [Pigeon adenovirus 1]|uniref:Hexon assembly protein 100K n=1 Tax=Pigeon adenovirus 1 TaxID=764030 RepID=X5LU16_9ADEN|nr:hexon assembly protein 100K [Pigeon adenovirus 1]CDO33906.1 hexon assembly protein 100K [Pigeon adenovirus 1]
MEAGHEPTATPPTESPQTSENETVGGESRHDANDVESQELDKTLALSETDLAHSPTPDNATEDRRAVEPPHHPQPQQQQHQPWPEPPAVVEDEGRGAAVAGPQLRTCLRRQATLLAGALRDARLCQEPTPLSVEGIQLQLERFVFNPPEGTPSEHAEARFNFYPPFLTPKAICTYHIFTVTAAIPLSCKANRSGTRELERFLQTDEFRRLPEWSGAAPTVDDGLGDEVVLRTELNEGVKLVPLEADNSRLQWSKYRAEHVQFFSYPSLHLPPKISRLLMETLLQPFSDEDLERRQRRRQAGESGDEPDEGPAPCLSDEELLEILRVQRPHASPQQLRREAQRRRTTVTTALRYCLPLTLMERFFREPSMVKKCQEALHHTLHQGFVQVVREVAKVNLSNYSTFHGVTYNNPLNNCVAAKLLEGEDRRDFTLDTLYLFLVLTWQTAMGMWQQAIDEGALEAYRRALQRALRAVYAQRSVGAVARLLADLLMDGDRLMIELRKAFPNFIAQSQVANFRHFLMERANIPPFAAPLLPSDMVPLRFCSAPQLLWDQVYLLQVAVFLLNHGGYLWEPVSEHPSLQEKLYCPCNLCAPHRMPGDNVALHNEMLAIGTFELRNADGQSFKLTPELWTNAYLDKFVQDDFFPFVVRHYVRAEHAERFVGERTACVTPSPEILSLIRQIEHAREEFLLTKGKGGYRDPKTGESLTDERTRRLAQPPDHHHHPPGQHAGQYRQALPAPGTSQRGGTSPPPSSPRPLRIASGAPLKPPRRRHGPGDVDPEGVCAGRGAGRGAPAPAGDLLGGSGGSGGRGGGGGGAARRRRRRGGRQSERGVAGQSGHPGERPQQPLLHPPAGGQEDENVAACGSGGVDQSPPASPSAEPPRGQGEPPSPDPRSRAGSDGGDDAASR